MAFYRGKEVSPLDDDPNNSAFKFNVNPDGTDSRSTPSDGSDGKKRVDLISGADTGDGLLTVGRHCSDPECHQLDFLPHLCHKCNRYFCLDHFQLTRHSCAEVLEHVNSMPRCPKCSQFVRVPRGQSKDGFVDRHIASGCSAHLLDPTEEQKREMRKAWQCDAECGNRAKLSTLQCPRCLGTYCLSHRFPDDHRCDHMRAELAARARGARLAAVARHRDRDSDRVAPAGSGAAPIAAAAGTGDNGISTGSGGFFGAVKSASQSLLEKLRLKREAKQAVAVSTAAAAGASAPLGSGTASSVAAGPIRPGAAPHSPQQSPSQASSHGHSVPNTSRAVLTAPAGSLKGSLPHSGPASGAATPLGASSALLPARSPSPALLPTSAAAALAAVHVPAPVSYLPAPQGSFGARATGSALQKLQKEAAGDSSIPIASRCCLVVRFPTEAPAGLRLPPALVRAGHRAVLWVDRRWTVGRVLDYVCKHAGVANQNHLSGRPKAHLAPAAAPGSAFAFSDKVESLEAVKDGSALAFGWTAIE